MSGCVLFLLLRCYGYSREGKSSRWPQGWTTSADSAVEQGDGIRRQGPRLKRETVEGKPPGVFPLFGVLWLCIAVGNWGPSIMFIIKKKTVSRSAKGSP